MTPQRILTLWPASIMHGREGFTLTLPGTGFRPGATVLCDGGALATVRRNSNRLQAGVPAHIVARAGRASVMVWNPDESVSNVGLLLVH